MKQLLMIFLGLFLFAACDSVDLKVLQRPGQEDRTDTEAFCNLDETNVVIRVQNVGTLDAPPAEVLVEFPSFGSQTVTTPAIPAGNVVEVQVPYPAGCFDSDCDYKIRVDPNNQIRESNENNNEQEAICIG